MDNKALIIWPFLLAFAVSAAAGPFLVPWLKALKMGQTERQEGVKEHLKKQGTPTMGGISFLIGIAVAGVIFIWKAPKIGPVLLLTFGYGLIGFADDYLKVVKRRSDGLYPKQKLALQIAVTAVFYLCVRFFTHTSLLLRLPFSGGRMLDLGFFAIPLLFFAAIGTVNGVNFTDGVDGLNSTVTVVVALFFTAASMILDGGIEPITSAVTGALLAFLLFNAYPAKIFMGDTGSLALGGFVAGCAYMLQMPLYILIVGMIYLIEVLSVMLQVSYFKLTHGKRIFRMAPIHHHFELSGWSETQVVARFSIATVILAAIGLLAI